MIVLLALCVPLGVLALLVTLVELARDPLGSGVPGAVPSCENPPCVPESVRRLLVRAGEE